MILPRTLFTRFLLGGALCLATVAVAQPPGGQPGGQPGGPGGPGGGGPRGFQRPPIGEILPPFERDRLDLTDDQIEQLDALQKEVDDRMAEILTAEQHQQLQERPGPGGPGGPGGGGFGPGRPGGGGNPGQGQPRGPRPEGGRPESEPPV